ncbi:hypothetical protein [Pedobacter sp. Leaf132]|uniref:hypothetical protein n=1 Tax=Pedobacter sp. Leaf132 TaxID=2876557 RepID=UPI001E365505|nr:hypothetical protein [Pedobacter sp. Leaf132]
MVLNINKVFGNECAVILGFISPIIRFIPMKGRDARYYRLPAAGRGLGTMGCSFWEEMIGAKPPQSLLENKEGS